MQNLQEILSLEDIQAAAELKKLLRAAVLKASTELSLTSPQSIAIVAET